MAHFGLLSLFSTWVPTQYDDPCRGNHHNFSYNTNLSSRANPLLFLPDFLALHPCAEHIPGAIKNDQVRVHAWPEGSLPILNTEAPRRIRRHAFNRFAQRTPGETRKVTDAGVKGDDTASQVGERLDMDHATVNGRDVPASEGVGALEIQFDAFLHEPLAITPFVYSVFQMRVQYFHGCGSPCKQITYDRHIEENTHHL